MPANHSITRSRNVAGQRIPVTARDRSDAVAIARTKPWWSRVVNPTPFASLGRWWFVVAPA